MGEQGSAKASSDRERARNERLAKALRENLRRRKTQSRNRDEETRAARPGARVPLDEDSKQP
jgi:hypothetical protein